MTAAEAALLRERAAEFGVDVDAPAIQRITTFLAILESWNPRLRLTGERDSRALADKHTLDSLAVAAFLPVSGTVVDIGSGAGFPGIVLSCVRPDLEVVAVDSRRRPVSFLREVIRQVPLPHTRALERRGEELATAEALGGRVALVVGRALRLDVFLPLASPLLAPEGMVIAMQTPRITLDEAIRGGEAHGLSLMRVHDYRLPQGEQRRLLLFARTW
jgi:16S rRNA (guanine527-N7)-methyltransferase